MSLRTATAISACLVFMSTSGLLASWTEKAVASAPEPPATSSSNGTAVPDSAKLASAKPLPSAGATDSANNCERQFARPVDDYFAFSFRSNPSWATDAGVHEYDKALEDMSQSGIKAKLHLNKEFLRRLEAIDSSKLLNASQIDYRLLKSHIGADILDIEQVGMWQHFINSTESCDFT